MLLTCVLVLCFASAVHYVQGQAAFAILVYPDQLILGTRSGLTDRFDVSVAAGERFNGTVSLSASGVPSGVSASFKETSS